MTSSGDAGAGGAPARALSATENAAPVSETGSGSASFRRAVASDIASVVEIERASFSDPWSAAAFRSALSEERMLFVVAESPTGQLMGYVVAWTAVDEAELANLAVVPSARGWGIGKSLVDAALRYGAERGCTHMYLEVRESNAAARAVYAARGFEQVGRRRRYYREPVEDALLLRCILPAPLGDEEST